MGWVSGVVTYQPGLRVEAVASDFDGALFFDDHFGCAVDLQ